MQGVPKKHPYDAFFGGKGNFFEISNEERVVWYIILNVFCAPIILVEEQN